MRRNIRWNLVFAVTGLCVLLLSISISAQESPQDQPGAPAPVSDQELKTFAKAYVQYDKIRQEYEPRLKNTEDPEEIKQIQQEANSRVEEELTKQGLTADAFKRILHIVNANDELRQKALRLIEEEKKKS
jgi:hypothetical protein